jgi:hypothetical protein
VNKRIKELALQAQNNGDSIHYYDPVFAKKFAELIVAECMQIIKVDMYEDAISNMWSKNKLQMIKQHFGVAE